MTYINIDISDENYRKFEFFKEDPSFENLWNTIQSIKKQSKLYYDLDNEDDEYFQKYINTIFEVIISFNSYLLKKYIKKNKEKKIDLNWEKIYNRKSSQNNFLYLIKQHIKYFDDYLFIIHSLYLWENLFRHQLAHGWIDVFKAILSKNDLSIFIDENFLHENFENSHLLTNTLETTINELRKYLKKESTNMSFDKNLIKRNINNVSGVEELTFSINIKNPDFFLRDIEKDILLQHSSLNQLDELNKSIVDMEKKILECKQPNENLQQNNEIIITKDRINKNINKLLKIKTSFTENPKGKMRLSLNSLLVDIWSIINISYDHEE